MGLNNPVRNLRMRHHSQLALSPKSKVKVAMMSRQPSRMYFLLYLSVSTPQGSSEIIRPTNTLDARIPEYYPAAFTLETSPRSTIMKGSYARIENATNPWKHWHI